MRYWLFVFGSLVLCGVCVVALNWGIWHLLLTGTCASGGPYVSARPCPPGTGGQILAVIGSIFGGLIGCGLWAARGRSGQRVEAAYPLPLLMWTLLFCGIAVSGLYATLGPAATKGAPKGTAIFLACLFIPMGLAPLLAIRGGRKIGIAGGNRTAQATELASTLQAIADQRSQTTAPPPTPTTEPPPPRGDDEDPIKKIERLAKLRDKGVISEAEFQVEKQRLLREV